MPTIKKKQRYRRQGNGLEDVNNFMKASARTDKGKGRMSEMSICICYLQCEGGSGW